MSSAAVPQLEAYLDIETTGLCPDQDRITVVGIYLTRGEKASFAQFVGDDITAEKLEQAMTGVRTLYTYNGSHFDLPFIHSRIGCNLARQHEHYDLMFSCWKQNLYGGLKKVERQLGIARQLTGIDGYQAVRLWWQYVNNYDKDALKTLLEYNKEDVVNLKALKEKLHPGS